jgi:hypothetical protein
MKMERYVTYPMVHRDQIALLGDQYFYELQAGFSDRRGGSTIQTESPREGFDVDDE